jgi:hypothetical protein
MKKVLSVLAAAAIASAVLAAPAQARGWRGGWGPGVGFGIAAGALAAGAYGAYGPYGYGLLWTPVRLWRSLLWPTPLLSPLSPLVNLEARISFGASFLSSFVGYVGHRTVRSDALPINAKLFGTIAADEGSASKGNNAAEI